MKKLISMILCLVMVAAFATCAFAADYNTRAIAREKVPVRCFAQPDVFINTATLQFYNVDDVNNKMVHATLSSDGHFFIVPTDEGFLYLGTGF